MPWARRRKAARFTRALGLALLVTLAYMVWRGLGLAAARGAGIAGGLRVLGRNIWLMLRQARPVIMGNDSRGVVLDAAKTTVMLMFIIANAAVCPYPHHRAHSPNHHQWMLDAGFNWFTFLIAVNICC